MSYTLILTEKPSAAGKIAHALADEKVERVSKYGAYYYKIKRKGKEMVVVPAVGHLFFLGTKSTNSEWTYPVFNVEWKPTFSSKNNKWAKKYFSNIQSLVKNASEFISATDYDVEGSVISFNIFRFICNVNDGKRMKFSTLTKPDLVSAYEHASPHLDFGQIEAGLTRHYLDFYFGINLSRALTLALEHSGGFWTLSTGRVQGPTLNILKKRQKEIEAFKPTPFWELILEGLINNQKISALHVEEKFWEKEKAEGILEKCRGKEGIVSEVSKEERKQFPYPPFDLTSLQRESYHLFGYSPKQTLDIAQTLYGHALISYPRTSSQKLPPKIGYKTILTKLSEQKDYFDLCEKLLKKSFLKPIEGKKTDPAHPAIFPTGLKPKVLNNYQKKIYDVIVKRFMSCFAEPAIREQTRIVIDVSGEKFAAHGIKTLKPNWFDFYKPYARFKEEQLPEIRKGDHVDIEKIDILEKETEPPNRYSQASVLKEMEQFNLGTKATRAHILQTLYDRSYIKERSIIVTDLGVAVIEALEKYCAEIISPDMTKRFEEDMEKIREGKEKREEIIADAEKELRKILMKFKQNEKSIGKEILKAVKEFEHEEHKLGKCECGGELHIIHSKKTGKRFIGCTNYPKCHVSYPLPQHGKISTISRTCKKCGLKHVMIKRYKSRAWRFCAKCGYEKYKEEQKTKSAKTN